MTTLRLRSLPGDCDGERRQARGRRALAPVGTAGVCCTCMPCSTSTPLQVAKAPAKSIPVPAGIKESIGMQGLR
jgi:hypothetical protein